MDPLKMKDALIEARRQYHQGKKINWKDGLAALWHITHFSLLA